MRYLALLFILSACGFTLTHRGTVIQKIELDVVGIIEGFQGFCEVAEPDNVDACVDSQIVNFFRNLAKAQNDS